MKNVLAFAHVICAAILLFGFSYYIIVAMWYIGHPMTQPISALESMREDIKMWMERALMFELGSSFGSKEKDQKGVETTTNLIDKLANSTPVTK